MPLDTRPIADLVEEDFVPVKWAEVKVGDVVYLRGTNDGFFRAYGPHQVDLPRVKSLRNERGMRFKQPKEILLKKVPRP